MKSFLKAKCRRTGKWFGLEVEKRGSDRAVITNFVDISEAMANMINPEYRVDPHIETGRNLVPCKYCHSRKFGSCSCNNNRKSCKPTDKYDFQCVYCNELEIVYSSDKSSNSSYNNIDITNLPKSAFDMHGNPKGDQYDLAKDGQLVGYRVVLMNYNNAVCCYFEDLKKVLKRKGFEVIQYNRQGTSVLHQYMGDKKTQIWIFSDYNYVSVSDVDLNFYINFFNQGGSLYIWGENDPINFDADKILKRMFDSGMKGDYKGDKIISIKANGSKSGIIPDHPIAKGVINFYEGMTIASVKPTQDLKPLVYNSEGGVVSAYYESSNARLLADGGYTRTYSDYIYKAGTERFIVNCAAWLANAESNEVNLPLLE